MVAINLSAQPKDKNIFPGMSFFDFKNYVLPYTSQGFSIKDTIGGWAGNWNFTFADEALKDVYFLTTINEDELEQANAKWASVKNELEIKLGIPISEFSDSIGVIKNRERKKDIDALKNAMWNTEHSVIKAGYYYTGNYPVMPMQMMSIGAEREYYIFRIDFAALLGGESKDWRFYPVWNLTFFETGVEIFLTRQYGVIIIQPGRVEKRLQD